MTAAMKLKDASPKEKSYDKTRYCIKKQRHHFADKGPHSLSYNFSSSHIWMWELDHKKGSVLKNWRFQIVVLEKTLESPLDSKEINQSILKKSMLSKTDADAPILWPSDRNWQLIGKDSAARKDWRQKEKRMTEDKMVGWHHQLNWSEFEQTQGNTEGQRSLGCYSPWGRKKSVTA